MVVCVPKSVHKEMSILAIGAVGGVTDGVGVDVK